MKLYCSTRSPFSRKVTLTAHELGLVDQLELIHVVVSILDPHAALVQLNPLGQIPTLVLNDGTVIHDSLVICDYLDALACDADRSVFPKTQPRRAEVLSRHALGQGMMETLVKLFSERKRIDDPLQPVYVAAYRDKFRRCADALERACSHHSAVDASIAAGTAVDIGDIAIACALAYADFRFAHEDWRDGRRSLAAWYAAFALRPSMIATEFSAPVE